MSRLMSVALTEQAVVERRKTVTRRLGWTFLKPGDRLTLCRKVQGRRKGEPLVRLAEVEVVSVERVRLARSFLGRTHSEIDKEGVDPLLWSDACVPAGFAWIHWFCTEMNVTPNDEVTRIEWRYLDG